MMESYKYLFGVIYDLHYEMSINYRHIIHTAPSCKSTTKLPTAYIISHYENYQNNTVSSKYNEGYKTNVALFGNFPQNFKKKDFIIIRIRIKKSVSLNGVEKNALKFL